MTDKAKYADNHIYDYKALSSRVLLVASVDTNIMEWACYIDAVKGIDHDKEWWEVARSGAKVPESVAKIFFPTFADNCNYRD